MTVSKQTLVFILAVLSLTYIFVLVGQSQFTGAPISSEISIFSGTLGGAVGYLVGGKKEDGSNQ